MLLEGTHVGHGLDGGMNSDKKRYFKGGKPYKLENPWTTDASSFCACPIQGCQTAAIYANKDVYKNHC